MLGRKWIAAIPLTAALVMTFGARAGVRRQQISGLEGRHGTAPARPRWVQPGEKAPLTPEYQAIFDWNTADQEAGGHGYGDVVEMPAAQACRAS